VFRRAPRVVTVVIQPRCVSSITGVITTHRADRGMTNAMSAYLNTWCTKTDHKTDETVTVGGKTRIHSATMSP